MACAALFLLGNALISGGNRSAGRDTWLVILGMTAITLLLGLLYMRILSLFPGHSFFEIIRIAFGNLLGNAMILILVLYFLLMYAFQIVDFGIYTAVDALPATPAVFVILPMLLLTWFLVTKGVQVIGRVSLFLLVCVIAYYLVNLFACFNYFRLENLLPMLHRPATDFISSATGLLAFPFAETVALVPLLHKVRHGTSKYKVFAAGLLLGGITFAYTAFQNITMLGESVYTMNYYPSFISISLIVVGNYIHHVEIVVCFAVLFCVFIKSAVCLYGVAQGIQSAFSVKEPKKILLFLAALAIIVMLPNVTSPHEIDRFGRNVYPYIAIPVQVGLPLMIWAGAEVKRRSTKTTSRG